MEPDRKCRAFVFAFAARGDGAAVHFYDRATDRQAETETAERAVLRACALFEWMEYARQAFRAHTHPGVADFDDKIDKFAVCAVGRQLSVCGDRPRLVESAHVNR